MTRLPHIGYTGLPKTPARMPITQPQLAKADRQRWASITLFDAALAAARAGHIKRAFRLSRASARCRFLSRRTFLTATARTA